MKARILCFVFLLSFHQNVHAADAVHGKELFKSRGCIGCHAVGSEGKGTAGPNLAGVTKKRKEKWLMQWIKDPSHMRNDKIIKQYEKKYPVPMPAAGLNDDEVKDIISYLAQIPALSKKVNKSSGK